MELRSKFDEEMENLSNDIVELGLLTKNAFVTVINALITKDKDIAIKVIRSDEEINNLEEKINEDGILLIAKQSPVAIDLRRIMTTIKMANDIERIADYSVNIAKYVVNTEGDNSKYAAKIKELSNLMLDMLDGIIEAAKTSDYKLAREVAEKDQILDKEYGMMVKELIKIGCEQTSIMAEEAIRALLVIKQIERAGDHITNIAENILYLVKGKRFDLN